MTAFHEYVMAVDRVEQRLRKATAALDAAGIAYAVIGGNAVAAWVATVDPRALRATRGVDLLVRREDVEQIDRALTDAGFERDSVRRLIMFTDPDEPSRRSGIHLVIAGEKVRPSYDEAAPSPDKAVRDPAGFAVIELAPLVRMKLTSFRDKDRTHLRDLIEVGLIDASWLATLPNALAGRLRELIDNPED